MRPPPGGCHEAGAFVMRAWGCARADACLFQQGREALLLPIPAFMREGASPAWAETPKARLRLGRSSTRSLAHLRVGLGSRILFG
jgi:hypothetical protein